MIMMMGKLNDITKKKDFRYKRSFIQKYKNKN